MRPLEKTVKIETRRSAAWLVLSLLGFTGGLLLPKLAPQLQLMLVLYYFAVAIELLFPITKGLAHVSKFLFISSAIALLLSHPLSNDILLTVCSANMILSLSIVRHGSPSSFLSAALLSVCPFAGAVLLAPEANWTLPLFGFLVIFASVVYTAQMPDSSTQALGGLLKKSVKLGVVIAIGLAALFALFPRRSYEGIYEGGRAGAIGFNGQGELSPTSFSELTESEQVAFRARIVGHFPDPAQLYWRGMALSSTSDGMYWLKNNEPPDAIRLADTNQSPIAQEILLEPRSQGVLLGIDHPTQMHLLPDKSQIYPLGTFFYLAQARTDRVLYSVESVTDAVNQPLSPTSLKKYSEPIHIDNAQLRALVQELKQNSPNARVFIDSITTFLLRERFTYTLTPGDWNSEEPLISFLFEAKRGFCGHYAAAIATLSRLVGFPSRVVIGFHGGDLNSFDGTLLVRDRDAHAWTEIWSKEESRWIRLDAVAMLAPLRLSQGADAMIGATKRAPWEKWASAWDQAWDAVITQWSFYRKGAKTSLFHFPKGFFSALIFLGATAIVALIFFFVLMKRFRTARAVPAVSPLDQLFEQFRLLLAQQGLAAKPSEGPVALIRRIEATLPAISTTARQFIERFIQLQYARSPKAALPEGAKELTSILRTLRNQLEK